MNERFHKEVNPVDQPPQNVNQKVSALNKTISRRNFIGGAAGLGTLAIGVGVAEGSIFADQNAVWEKASQQNDIFIEENKDVLSHIKYGASFSPEMFGLSLEWQQMESEQYTSQQDFMIQCLDAVINDFGISDIRLGIQWKNAVDPHDPDYVTLDFYHPVIEKCIQNNVNITLNTGAIKTFRYPEMHVPEKVLHQTPLPPEGAIVIPQDPIAQSANEYLGKLYSEIHRLWTPQELKRIVAIQPENEGFNAFGSKKWVMSDEYYRQIINLTHTYFPDTSILLNSAGAKDLGKIRNLFNKVLSDKPEFAGRLIAGIDYYYLKPDSVHLPFVKPALEPVTIAKMKAFYSMDEFTRHSFETAGSGIRTEITESQAEKWGKVTLPQESSQGFKFKTLRMSPFTDEIERIWGIEGFSNRYVTGKGRENLLWGTKDNREVIDLIKRINSGEAKLRNAPLVF